MFYSNAFATHQTSIVVVHGRAFLLQKLINVWVGTIHEYDIKQNFQNFGGYGIFVFA